MKIIEITDDLIKFDNGVKIKYLHSQDCCENVYCDFKSLKDTNIMEFEFDEIKIEPVECSGFRLNGFFVPCYNEQDGTYSDNLELIIDYGTYKKVYDLCDLNCIKDDIWYKQLWKKYS